MPMQHQHERTTEVIACPPRPSLVVHELDVRELVADPQRHGTDPRGGAIILCADAFRQSDVGSVRLVRSIQLVLPAVLLTMAAEARANRLAGCGRLRPRETSGSAA
jgi:hypothetical protein